MATVGVVNGGVSTEGVGGGLGVYHFIISGFPWKSDPLAAYET